jgi:allantoinase
VAETVIRGGTIVTAEGTRVADVRIEGGQITEIGPELGAGRQERTGSQEIDARGLHLLPGGIDVHVHFNEPGRTEWEGAATGSRALAAGGGTTFFDMPLNSTPCTVNVREFDRKRAALEAASVADFGLWGGLVPGGVPEMAEMAARGVVGFKAFMCDSGLPEFPRADDLTLFDGMREAARLRLPVAVHAESHELTSALAARITGRDGRDFLNARPVVAELEAIQRALFFAGETGASLHLVHVSSGRGVALATEAKARGVDVSIETCAHHLYFTEDDVERLGALAKCAPPLRSAEERERLWSELAARHIDIVASDHSPTEPAMKRGDFVGAWGGIAGVQSTLAVLLDCGWHERATPLEQIAQLIAAEPARRFRIARKGAVTPGADADITLVDVASAFTLREQDLQQRHPMTPYLGARFRGIVRRTLRRGETIFDDGAITATGRGQLVRPSRG